MKANLEFNLPEENEEFKTMLNAKKCRLALWEFSQGALRQVYKTGTFNNKKLTEDQWKLFDHIREEFYRVINEHDVDLE